MMFKSKILYLIIVLSIISLVDIIIFTLNKLNGQEINEIPIQENKDVIVKIFNPDSNYAKQIHKQIIEKGKFFTDTEGIKTSIWFSDDSNTPLIEILCKERTLDNTILPLVVSSIDIVSQEINYGMSHSIKGTGLRINIGNDCNSKDVKLQFNTEYTVKGIYHLPEDPNNIARGQTSKVTFRTPKSLSPCEIYRVDLILIDRIKEQQELEQAKIAKAERARIENEETITLQFSDFPKYDNHGIWQIEYSDGKKARSFKRIDDKIFALKGPNKLGGDISVYYLTTDNDFHPWLNITDVQKRMLHLPDDASIVMNEDEMVQTKISLAQIDPNILSEYKMIAFYNNKDAKLPLFWIPVMKESFQKLKDNNWQTEMKVRPGTYYVKLFKKLDIQIDMGVVEFTNESGKTYMLGIK